LSSTWFLSIFKGSRGNKLYVGNLAYSVRDDSLQQAFGQFGTVTSAKVMMDRETGRSKASVREMARTPRRKPPSTHERPGLEGRAIVVNEARPREERRVALAAAWWPQRRRWWWLWRRRWWWRYGAAAAAVPAAAVA